MAKILVVDDQPSITWLLSAVLSGEGHVVFTADGAQEALDSMGEHRPELVITDVQMPLMNGFALVSEICDKFPGTKCILMSGDIDFDDPEALAETCRLQVRATLAKPFLMGTLVELVERVLQEAPPARLP